MGFSTTYLTEEMLQFIKEQKMYFVATCPLAQDGKINVSPKGLTTSFVVLNPNKVMYLDYTGSGIETFAHVKKNGRLTIMMCSFGEKANILRMYGAGRVIETGSTEFEELFSEHFEGEAPRDGTRGIVELTITRTSNSCGGGVPLYTFDHERKAVFDWNAEVAQNRKLHRYWKKNNAKSLDDLEGLDPATIDQTQFSKRRSSRKPAAGGKSSSPLNVASLGVLGLGVVLGYVGPIALSCLTGGDSCPF